MKIGIVGTRGIPNHYGGFEQFVEFVAPEMVLRGHEVFVYSSSLHPYKESSYKGVNIISKYDPENKIGTAGQFVFDFNCVLDARKRNYDIILQLGYTSSSIWSFLFPKNSILVTNMDGLEWKRTKYSKPVRKFLKQAERWAALYSDALIADSKGIQRYLKAKYNKKSEFIAYGANLFTTPNEEVLKKYGLVKDSYNVLVARMEPENNVETIIKGHVQSGYHTPLVVIGGYNNSFGNYLKNTYQHPGITFMGPVYNLEVLNNIRYYSKLYFHGHSVGGTNPSLLEAMASNCLIAAHDNVFNSSVLEKDAFYFRSPKDVAAIVTKVPDKSFYQEYVDNNALKIEEDYSWEHIVDKLENYLLRQLVPTPQEKPIRSFPQQIEVEKSIK